MEDLGLLGDLAVVIVAALAGGAVAHVLRLPSILGYLTAGLIIGPHSVGLVDQVDRVETAADLGVALLMFTLGVQVSFRSLGRVRDVAMVGGVIQIGVMIALGALVGQWLGMDSAASILLGSVVALSSTIVALSLLERKGEIDSLQGAITAGFALVQDLAVVPLIVVIPALTADGGDTMADLGIAVAKAAGLLLAIYVLGVRLVPWLFSRVVGTRSRELFLLAIVSLALGTAVMGFLAGLSLAFGAFLAGLLVSESDYAHQTVAEVLPLREIFAVVFFVSIGMLIEPRVFVNDSATVLGVASLGVVGKAVLVTSLALAFGYSARAALAAGLALANMGEFSFVLMGAGVDEGIFSGSQNEAVLGGVLLSIAVGPFLVEAQPLLQRSMARLPIGRWLFQERVQAYLDEEREELVHHAVICGYGEAGRELAAALDRRSFKYVVVDQDPLAVAQLRRQGKPCIYGDASSPLVLGQANLERAWVLAVTTRDISAAQAVVMAARRMVPGLDVIVRGADVRSHLALQEAGATEIVHAEFEVGLEFVRHTLHRFGVSTMEIEAGLGRRRRDYYTSG